MKHEGWVTQFKRFFELKNLNSNLVALEDVGTAGAFVAQGLAIVDFALAVAEYGGVDDRGAHLAARFAEVHLAARFTAVAQGFAADGGAFEFHFQIFAVEMERNAFAVAVYAGGGSRADGSHEECCEKEQAFHNFSPVEVCEPEAIVESYPFAGQKI